jgi:hypothetical protein
MAETIWRENGSYTPGGPLKNKSGQVLTGNGKGLGKHYTVFSVAKCY